MGTPRIAVAAAALALLLSACAGGSDDGQPTDSDAATGGDVASRADAGSGTASALDDPSDPSFPDPLIDLDDLLSGGPPPDGIPSIDEPTFQDVADVDWLEDDEPVMSLTVGGETRAYPIRIMTWHEIVNDTVGGAPVTVTYCPLCNSGVAFGRIVDGEPTTFGVSGKLYADNLVMFDRRTESLWPQLTGQASVGALTGTQLDSIPMGSVGWAQFRTEHPDATVLSRDTGFERDYGLNPYVGYDDPDTDPIFPLPGEADERLPAKARVVGVTRRGESAAVPRDALAEAGVASLTLGGDRVVLWHVPGQRSALDSREIPEGEEIGTVAVFDPSVGKRSLDFERTRSGETVDEQTGSTWNVFGRATSGPLKGRELRPITHLDTFWFAWVAFQPDTDLVTP
ncbi:DUF3179 domain-containing protein [Nocardioides donggukensis]|uniref:DUF3179 domain-containing protein n=1 Tax=Nocardioides donggukensis TaxID=2774019 RepID=A0A927Q1R5_9ACTN|nr:DUF3179 domain-containing protein [Nocardioides donggukensis]MBD8870422.1 DUF3179 domain-containing protein [Nocardioides donggukensis]